MMHAKILLLEDLEIVLCHVTSALHTTAPHTTVPYTTAPHTTVPCTTAPHTTVPCTTAPRTTVPYTTAPHATVPYTQHLALLCLALQHLTRRMCWPLVTFLCMLQQIKTSLAQFQMQHRRPQIWLVASLARSASSRLHSPLSAHHCQPLMPLMLQGLH